MLCDDRRPPQPCYVRRRDLLRPRWSLDGRGVPHIFRGLAECARGVRLDTTHDTGAKVQSQHVMKQRAMRSTFGRELRRPDATGSTQFRTIVCQRSDPRWKRYIALLENAGFPVPAFALPSFTAASGQATRLVVLEREDGEVLWAAAAEVGRSRILPWRRIVRLPRFGPGITPQIRDGVVSALIELAATERALRVHVEIFAPRPEDRNALTEALAHRKFQVASHQRCYASTVFIDLRGSEQEILATFHSKTRRDIRAISKYPLECRPITEPKLSDRLNELLGISMSRTGGRFDETRWTDVLAFVATDPTRAALIGVFRTDIVGTEALVGYVLGYRHADTVQYSVAACARLADMRAPLLYAPTWELMRWGKRNGARWFDFGGVTTGSRASGDRAAGISDFKRYFCANVQSVAAEMVFSPVPRLSRLAAFVSAMASRLPFSG